MAYPGQRRAQGTNAAGHTWPAALFVVLVPCAWPGFAFANLILESGVSISQKSQPYFALDYRSEQDLRDWNSVLAVDAKIEPDNPLGDASVKIEWHADTHSSAFSLIEVDGLYEYVRASDNFVEQYHDLGFDIGAKHNFGDWDIKADAGLFGRIHQDTLRPGFRTLDRNEESFVESDLALRAIFAPRQPVHVFLEAAIIRRDYGIDTGRGFMGGDLIVGLEFANGTVRGDAALFWGLRDIEDSAVTSVFGPQLDMSWFPQAGTEVALHIATGAEQKTAGSADIYPFYEAELSLKQALSETVLLSAVMTSSIEKHRSGDEIELEPVLKLEGAIRHGVNIFGSAGAVYSMIEGEDSSWSPAMTIGIKWTL